MKSNRSISSSRFAPLYKIGLSYFFISTLLRVVLYFSFAQRSETSIGQIFHAFFVGFRFDAAFLAYAFLLPAFVFVFLSEGKFQSRSFFYALKFITFFGFFIFWFIGVIEYSFFEEFNSRFNTVAVDYLIYPTEVFVNIWESYPAGKLIFGCLVLGYLSYRNTKRSIESAIQSSMGIFRRLMWLGTYLVLAILMTQTVSLKKVHLSDNRILNEIAKNGPYSFFNAAFTRHLDYVTNYPTLSQEEAYARTRHLVSQQNATLSADPMSIEKIVSASTPAKAKNLVIILVESFGSEFWGSLGRSEPTLTPELDELSKEGLLFTNMYASGNRTVRGLEGVLASFPPLAGDSIVKRDMSDHVSTIARVLKEKNYQTTFMYGGRGVFDGMRSFTTRNGYDRFIEQKDFKNPTFSTIWGVCDEDLFSKGIEELRELHKSGKPYFVTFLTVSNHKPYTYPKGRIPENPDQHSRSHAVKYTDYSIGEFLKKAKQEPFFRDTIFAVVADHGARVYGAQEIPIKSYRIPLLVLGDTGMKPDRIDRLGGSLDVGPTLLGMMGLSYNSVFFGRDLFQIKPGENWAIMHHNYDMGLFNGHHMVVVSLNKRFHFYEMNSSTHDLQPVGITTDEDEELKRNALAAFQVADNLYTHEKYFPK